MKSSTGAETAAVIERVPLALRAYRLLSAAAEPLTPILLTYRRRRGKEHPARMDERRGRSKIPRPRGPLVWVHGASVGELMTAFPLVERIRARGVGVLVTSGTITSARLAQQRLPRGVIHQFVPLDTPRFVSRFLDHWRPNLALFVESDLWPNLILESTSRGVPMILVNGRLSESSFQRWRYMRGMIAGLLGRFDLCLARTRDDAERFGELGAPRIITTGNLKLDVPAPPASDIMLQSARAAIGKRPVIAAASTHPGEEAMLMDSFRRLRQSFPGLLLLLAPRHPERGPGIAEIAAAAGFNASLRSRGQPLDAKTDVYIADTVGELGLLYRLATIVFIGGSLVRHGGQNPIEAAKLGAALLHGPHVGNFTDIYAALDQARGAERVEDAEALTMRLGALLSDPAARARVADAARVTVEALGGALDRTLGALDPYLMQLRIEQSHA